MRSAASRKKRSILKVAPLLPMLLIVFIAGWIIYQIGKIGQLKAKQPLTISQPLPHKFRQFKIINAKSEAKAPRL